jgi:DNA-binding NarL/FixJ family response regulator
MTEVASPVRVLLVDDDPLVCAGLRMMLAGADGVVVVDEVGDGSQVADAVARHAPDVVLMDIRMPVMDGISATRALAAASGPSPQVIVLTTFDGDAAVLESLRAGAAGFLLKHTDPERIVESVRRAAAGEPVLSPSVARALMDRAARDAGPAGSAARQREAQEKLTLLSEREREVAEAVAEGLSNAEISARLYMSTGTVKTHISSALSKLDLTSRVPLALLIRDAQGP